MNGRGPQKKAFKSKLSKRLAVRKFIDVYSTFFMKSNKEFLSFCRFCKEPKDKTNLSPSSHDKEFILRLKTRKTNRVIFSE